MSKRKRETDVTESEEKELLNEIQQFAVKKLKEWGLNNWSLVWDESVVRYGQCRHHKHEIGLSKPLTKRNSIEHSKDTVLHESAHALTGEGHGHNAVWKRTCVKVGARPERCYNGDVKTFVGKYKLINKDTGQVYRHYHRKPNVSDWPQRWIPGKKEETYGKLQLQLIVSAETEAAPSNGKKRKRAHRAHVTESEEKEDVQTLSSTLTENYSLDGFNRF